MHQQQKYHTLTSFHTWVKTSDRSTLETSYKISEVEVAQRMLDTIGSEIVSTLIQKNTTL